MPFIIGLDLGTTNTKAIALDLNGRVVTASSCGYPMYTPQPGYAEQDPELVWQGAVKALQNITSQLEPKEVTGLCLSGAMHSCLPVRKDGTPLGRALTWADQRASTIARTLRNHTQTIPLYQRTGCPLQPIYHIAKIRWWVEQLPSFTPEVEYYVTLKDYVVYHLTKQWLGDYSVSSATGLLDIHHYQWDSEALELAGITEKQLIPLASPFTRVGVLSKSASLATGLPPQTPVILGASDGGLANLGSGASRPGQSVITVGTSGAVRRIVEKPYLDVPSHTAEDEKQLERTWCYILCEGRWFAGGAINNGGLALQWVREKFYPDLIGDTGYQQLFADSIEVHPGSDGVMILPYFAGERSPYWNAEARATVTGLSLEHGRRHVARAVLEGVAYRLAEIWNALSAPDSAEPVHLTGSIVNSSIWAQIVCDAIGTPMVAVEAGDASAIGAAMLGTVALGYSQSLDDLAAQVQPGVSWQPNLQNHRFYQIELAKYRKVYSALYPGY